MGTMTRLVQKLDESAAAETARATGATQPTDMDGAVAAPEATAPEIPPEASTSRFVVEKPGGEAGDSSPPSDAPTGDSPSAPVDSRESKPVDFAPHEVGAAEDPASASTQASVDAGASEPADEGAPQVAAVECAPSAEPQPASTPIGESPPDVAPVVTVDSPGSGHALFDASEIEQAEEAIAATEAASADDPELKTAPPPPEHVSPAEPPTTPVVEPSSRRKTETRSFRTASAPAPIAAAAPRFTAFQRPAAAPSTFATGPTCGLAPSTVEASIVALREPSGAVAEQIRGAAARLTSMNADGAHSVLAITSAVRGEGKSVFCANLALMLSEGGHRQVVVVDGDLRSGALAGLLGAQREPGLADVLRGEASLSDAIHSTSRPGFFIIPAGRAGGSGPAELLAGPTLADVIARLHEAVDYVLVDTPAVTVCADAMLIARACDAALMVVAAGRTAESMVERAASALRGNSISILGAVMTGCEERSAS